MPSRLTLAWVGLFAVVLAAAGAVLLAPAPSRDDGIALVLPDEPQRLAQGLWSADSPLPAALDFPPADETGATDPPAPAPDDSEDVERLPATAAEAVSDAGEGAVVITLPAPSDAETRRQSRGPLAPLTDLRRRTAAGLAPAVGADGLRPFDAYRRQGPLPDGPQLAIVLAGLGLDEARTAEAIASLPPEIAFSFAPYGGAVAEFMATAAGKGHEVLVELPMEASRVPDAALGPAALLTSRAPEANARRLDWLLARAPAYPMVTGYLGDVLTADDAALRPLLATVQQAGLAYLDETGEAAALARELGLPYAAVDRVIAPDGAVSLAALDPLVGGLGPGDRAVVKIYVTENGLPALQAFLSRAQEAGIGLVPVSAAVKERP